MKLRRQLLLPIAVFLLIACYPRLSPTGNVNNQQTKTSQTGIPTPSETNEINMYVGLKYPPLPSSIETSTSWEQAISPPSPQYWWIAAVADRDNLMLWFSKTIYYDQEGKAYSQVSDVVILPPTARDKDIIVSACLLENVLDPEIIALVRLDKESLEKRYLPNSNIVLAWRANQSTGKLEQISTKGIECYAETFLGYP